MRGIITMSRPKNWKSAKSTLRGAPLPGQSERGTSEGSPGSGAHSSRVKFFLADFQFLSQGHNLIGPHYFPKRTSASIWTRYMVLVNPHYPVECLATLSLLSPPVSEGGSNPRRRASPFSIWELLFSLSLSHRGGNQVQWTRGEEDVT